MGHRFFALDRKIFELDLSSTEFKLYVYLVGMSDGNDRIENSLTQLSLRTKINRGTIVKSLNKLEELNLIKRHNRYYSDGRNAPNIIEVYRP